MRLKAVFLGKVIFPLEKSNNDFSFSIHWNCYLVINLVKSYYLNNEDIKGIRYSVKS